MGKDGVGPNEPARDKMRHAMRFHMVFYCL